MARQRAADSADRTHRDRRSGGTELTNRELPGLSDGVSGSQLAQRARQQAEKFGAELITARTATALEVNGSKRTVRFADGGSIDAHAVILATGVAYRQLEATGCAELTGRGIYYGAATSIASECAGEDVYVIGGANSAGQAAMFLSREAALGDHCRARHVVGGVDVLLPDPADRTEPKNHRSHLLRSSLRRGNRPPGALTLIDNRHRQYRRRQLRADVHLHRRRTAHRLGSTAYSPATTTASS